MKFAFPESLKTITYPTEFREETIRETNQLCEILERQWPKIVAIVGETGPFKDMFIYQLGRKLNNRTGQYLFAPSDLGSFDITLPPSGWYYISGLDLLDNRWLPNVSIVLQKALSGKSSVFLDVGTSDLDTILGSTITSRIRPHLLMYSFKFIQPKTIQKV